MKRSLLTLMAGACLMTPHLVAAEGVTLRYGLEPGQVWNATSTTRTESSIAGIESSDGRETLIEYRVKAGERAGWWALEARQLSPKTPGFGLDTVTFRAQMHSSGELRDIGFDLDPLQPGQESDPSVAVMRQAMQGVADASTVGFFWFPEFPEEPLEPGDEFDAEIRSGGGPAETSGMQTKIVVRSVYTLDEIVDGLAYFTVRERLVTGTTTPAGTVETRGASKGEAVFDLEQGMWIEQESRMEMTFEGAGMPVGGDGGASSRMVTRMRLELVSD